MNVARGSKAPQARAAVVVPTTAQAVQQLHQLEAVLQARVAALQADLATLEAAITQMRQRYPDVERQVVAPPQCWLLLQVDYENAVVLGVYPSQTRAVQVQQTLWARYRALSAAQQTVAGPVGLQHEASLTWETFTQWHPLEAVAVDAVPETYTHVATLEEA